MVKLNRKVRLWYNAVRNEMGDFLMENGVINRYNAIRVAVCAVAFCAIATAAQAESAATEGIGGTIMPLGSILDAKTDVGVAKMLKIKEMSGVSLFSIGGPGRAVRINGVADIATYEKIGRKIRALSEAVAPHGIKISSNLTPTMNWGAGHPWRKFTFSTGSVREFAVCQGDEGFRKDFAAKCAAMVREAKPFAHNFSDDFRYFGNGCFCDDHVARFDALTGVKRGRKALAKAMKRALKVETVFLPRSDQKG